MIVDDEALVLLDLVYTVEELGFAVHSEATTVRAAREALAKSCPDVALLDIDVGGDPVWPLARELKKHGSPIVFLSANLSHDELKDEFGCCGRIEKPVSRAQIAKALETALQQRPSFLSQAD